MSPDDEAIVDALREQASTGDRAVVDAAWRLEQLAEENERLRAILDERNELLGKLTEVHEGRAARVNALAQHYIDAQAAAGAAWREGLGKASSTATSSPTTATGTVCELLARLPVVEWCSENVWWQASTRLRFWHSASATWSSWKGWPSGMASPASTPARLVPADEADADPATRGPL